ncbi:YqcI/YcgG family protein [Bacillus sp. B1-b2]|uniref:YqcI/YcgG family protein n=1 Tax=Bacillus sp. B1-b2 TaxID=2653201 RepID=UPI00126159C6|nr:YqcI/YcgG family protein [Bacillus sp. B1-b2]KAB7667104.1 YqcI/YcgG family protein [Bacillus sp. B1-b2]
MLGLYKDSLDNRKNLNDQERLLIEEFEKKMTDNKKPFPCIPATIGFSMNHLRYGFIGDPTEEKTTLELVDILKEFTIYSRDYGKYTSLIVFYQIPNELMSVSKVEDYEQLFWEQLSRLSSVDEMDWVGDIPTDPEDPLWEFCFHREKYFMYCATPSHQARKSRHFQTMMLAITPRWVLIEFNKKESFAKNIKKQIRKRVSNYDSIDIHPDLNTYGAEENFEWKQYFLRDDDSTISKCPYNRFLHLLKRS